jgi:hypothetical protein
MRMPPSSTSATTACTADVQRQLQRRVGQRGVAQPRVQHVLDAGGADDLGGGHALLAKASPRPAHARPAGRWDKAASRAAEQQPGFADVMHRLHLFGRQPRAHPDEAAVRIGQPRRQPLGVDSGKDARQFARGARPSTM